MAERALYVEAADPDDADFPWPRIRDREGYSYVLFDPSRLGEGEAQELAGAADAAHPDDYDAVWDDIRSAVVAAGAFRGEN